MAWSDRLVGLEAHHIVTRAMKQSGADDFGSANWSEPLEVLCTDLRRHPPASLEARRWARDLLVSILVNRAELASTSAAAPPDPLRYEVVATTPDLAPDPTVTVGTNDDDLMTVSLCSIRFEQWWHVPGYAEWLDDANLSEAYGELDAIRRDSAPGAPGAPIGVLHLEHIDDLLAASPGVNVRRLVDASDAGLDAATTAMTAEVDRRRAESGGPSEPVSIEKYWRWRLARMIERSYERTPIGTPRVTDDGPLPPAL